MKVQTVNVLPFEPARKHAPPPSSGDDGQFERLFVSASKKVDSQAASTAADRPGSGQGGNDKVQEQAADKPEAEEAKAARAQNQDADTTRGAAEDGDDATGEDSTATVDRDESEVVSEAPSDDQIEVDAEAAAEIVVNQSQAVTRSTAPGETATDKTDGDADKPADSSAKVDRDAAPTADVHQPKIKPQANPQSSQAQSREKSESDTAEKASAEPITATSATDETIADEVVIAQKASDSTKTDQPVATNTSPTKKGEAELQRQEPANAVGVHRSTNAPQTFDTQSGSDQQQSSADSKSSNARHQAQVTVTNVEPAPQPTQPTSAQPVVAVETLELESTRLEPTTVANAAQTTTNTTSTTATSALHAPTAGLNEADANRVADQALRGIRSVINQGGGSLTLRLNPPDLGALRIRIEIHNNIVQARFEASTDMAKHLLQTQLHTLRTALQTQGLTVEHLHVQTQPTPPNTNSQTAHEDGRSDEGRSRGAFDHGGSHGGKDDGDDPENAARQARNFQRELLDLVA